MHRLLVLAFAAVLIPSGACIIVEDDGTDGPGGGGGSGGGGGGGGGGELTGYLSVSWNLTSIEGEPCPEGGAVEVVAQGPEQEYVDVFDCLDGTGVTAALPLDDYVVWANVLTYDELLWAQSFAADVSLASDGETVPVTFDILTDEGFFYATWSLTEEGTNAELTCAEVGADGVSMLSTLVGPDGMGYDDIFDCADYEGTTLGLPVGDYDVVVSLLDGDHELAQSMTRETAITFGNELVDLGNFEFTFEPL